MRYAQALKRAEYYVGQHPTTASLKVELAQIQLQMGQTQEASTNLKRALIQDENLISARVLLAKIALLGLMILYVKIKCFL